MMLSDVSSMLSSKSEKERIGRGGGGSGRGVMVKSISESSGGSSVGMLFSGSDVEMFILELFSASGVGISGILFSQCIKSSVISSSS